MASSGSISPWSVNQHRVPLTQYGQYWSSVGQLLEEQADEETDGPQDDTAQHRMRKISNIPMGESDNEEEYEDFQEEVDYMPNGYNGNTAKTRDVRFKKTKFQNLSPFRR